MLQYLGVCFGKGRRYNAIEQVHLAQNSEYEQLRSIHWLVETREGLAVPAIVDHGIRRSQDSRP